MTTSLREQRCSRIAKKRLEAIRLRELAAWGEYAAFCGAYRTGAVTADEYESVEPSQWHRLRATLNAHAFERRMLILELGEPRA